MSVPFKCIQKGCILLVWLACLLTGEPLYAKPFKTETANRENYRKYIRDYYQTAIRQQRKYKIPASITLAQAILESSAGQSYLAMGGNNHFGIKCNDWDGLCIYKNHTDGHACYRKYLDAADSYEDHSRFLTGRAHYRPLFNLPATDYKGWAKGLKQCGYATDPQYAAKLIQLIESYQLYLYDTANENDKNLPAAQRDATSPATATRKASSPVPKK